MTFLRGELVIPNTDPRSDVLPQRLCSEIQLFDLCDLESCKRKKGRFCTDVVLLNRFEKIAEKELRVQESYISEDIDDEADGCDGEDFAAEDFECDDDEDRE